MGNDKQSLKPLIIKVIQVHIDNIYFWVKSNLNWIRSSYTCHLQLVHFNGNWSQSTYIQTSTWFRTNKNMIILQWKWVTTCFYSNLVQSRGHTKVQYTMYFCLSFNLNGGFIHMYLYWLKMTEMKPKVTGLLTFGNNSFVHLHLTIIVYSTYV